MTKLISWNKIELDLIDGEVCQYLLINDKEIPFVVENGVLIFNYDQEVLGKRIILKLNDKEQVVSVREAPLFSDFDDRYFYDGNDLGSTFYFDHTDFVLWAPLASKVLLRVKGQEIEMIRGDKGIFRATIFDNLDGELYDLIITIDEKTIISIDPYGKSSNANLEKSAVINFEKLNIKTYSECLPEFNQYVESIIYEGHIRDLTIHPSTNIINKGKYLGLTESGRTSPNYNPVGLDYLKYLGITHLQLLPVLDYGSVDEIKIDKYNWGYDPMQFFALEGSYSLNPNDPYSRMIEFKTLVSTLHKNGIRVNLDVVYNHVYKYDLFSLNKITPNYFFRFENGKMANHSGCGNDFQSERKMARKIIVDSILFLLKTYDVDGFRFDLMGLIDIDTMNELTRKVLEIKNDAMIYGEGWDMYSVSNYGAKFANMKNANLLPNIAFFNDSYRNIIRGIGSTSILKEPGFLLGNKCYIDGFKFAYSGSTIDYPFPHLFTNLNQTLNYIECHDNATIYDIISDSTDFDEKLRIIKLVNKVLLLSPGVAFIHMGQEFGATKYSNANSYNAGDKYNQFDPNLMDERIEIVNSFKGYIELRKSIDLFKISDANVVNNSIEYIVRDDILDVVLHTNFNYHILINQNDYKVNLFDEYYSNLKLVIPDKLKSFTETVYASSVGIGPHKCSIFKE